MSIKVASFNINGIKARLPRLLEWLEETRPAVACLQEIKTQDADFPAAEFEKIGYHAIWHGQKGFNGVALPPDGLSPVEVQRGRAGEAGGGQIMGGPWAGLAWGCTHKGSRPASEPASRPASQPVCSHLVNLWVVDDLIGDEKLLVRVGIACLVRHAHRTLHSPAVAVRLGQPHSDFALLPCVAILTHLRHQA